MTIDNDEFDQLLHRDRGEDQVVELLEILRQLKPAQQQDMMAVGRELLDRAELERRAKIN